ncbi:tetratricopeptide repeat protein [Xanthomonas cissicola]|uniref:tetratricopeptide repeat protein n=1 Tax=Xanthomonas cissicola TaxID=86186 RepID=UPI001116B2FC|nr:sel1 repeat family protein [Xanthomonas cissicola]KAB0529389.1 sel1 repeat family protein [Xanthomonas cissicola]
MNWKHFAGGFTAVLAVTTISFFVYRLDHSLHSGEGNLGGYERAIAPKNDLVVARQYSSSLVAANKVDAKFIKPIGSKTFSIVRNEQRPKGDALNYVNSLLEKSKAGDASATYSIYLAVAQCNATLQPPSQAVLDGYRKIGAEKSYLSTLEENFEECKSLTEHSDLMKAAWLQKAAEQGSIEAMIVYATDPDSVIGSPADYLSHPERLVEYRKKSINYLNQAASMGSVDALMALARVYDNGILADKSPVKSYAYYKALQVVQPDIDLRSTLIRSQSQLSSNQLSQANQMANEIVGSCCK